MFTNNNINEKSFTLQQYVHRRETLGMLLNKINLLNKDVINLILDFVMLPMTVSCVINNVNQEIAIISIKELSNKIFLDNQTNIFTIFGAVKRYYGWHLVYNSKLKRI